MMIQGEHLREKRVGLEISALLLELVATLMNIQKKEVVFYKFVCACALTRNMKE